MPYSAGVPRVAPTMDERVTSIEAVEIGLSDVGYIPSRQIATAVYLAHRLQKPILVEGPAGVGKTELAKSIASWLELPLIRMQCYEGLDEAKALYEWKYGKQLLYTQILRDKIGEVLGDTPTLECRPRPSCTISVTCSSPPSSWSRARCCAPCRPRPAPCCWSMRWTSPIRSSRRSCWRSSPIIR